MLERILYMYRLAFYRTRQVYDVRTRPEWLNNRIINPCYYILYCGTVRAVRFTNGKSMLCSTVARFTEFKSTVPYGLFFMRDAVIHQIV